MSEFTKGKWFLSSYQTKARKHKKIDVIAGVSVSEGVIKKVSTISGTDAEAIANYGITYQVLQTATAELLNNIHRKENGL